MKSKWLALLAGLFAVATTLFPAQSSYASIVMNPDPVVFTGNIDDGVSTVGSLTISWSLLGVDPTLARYTYRVTGAVVGQVLPNSIPGDLDFVIEYDIVPFPSACCTQHAEFANVLNVAGLFEDPVGTHWFLGFELLAPTFSFDLTLSVISEEGGTDEYPAGTPVLLTEQAMSCSMPFLPPPSFSGDCGNQDVSFRDTDLLVSEPAMLLLFGIALAGLGFSRRRKLH